MESRGEWVCIGHWVAEPAYQRYAISLRSDFAHVGDYRWLYSNGSTAVPDYFVWADAHPSDYGIYPGTWGQWIDGVSVRDNNIFGICERN